MYHNRSEMSRRSFLGYTGAVTAAFVLGSSLPGCSKPVRPEVPPEVIPEPPVIPPSPLEIDIGAVVGNWTEGDYPWSISFKRQDYINSQAVSSVDMNENNPKEGRGSLEMKINAVANSSNYRNGEVFVDLRYPPAYAANAQFDIARTGDGKPLGVDLSDKTLSFWLNCPLNVAGPQHAPNGIQIFLKSVDIDANGNESWKSYYGNWQNIWIIRDQNADPELGYLTAGGWSMVDLIVPHLTAEGLSRNPSYGSVDPGFNPEHVALIGIKYGLNQDASGTVDSTIYIDEFGIADESHAHDALFSFDYVKNPIEALASNRFNAASVLQTEYMDTIGSTSIHPVSKKSHSDDEVVALMREIKRNGMKLMVKPHVDVATDEWRGTLAFASQADKDAWFNDYTRFMTHYAALAEQEGADSLVVATELESLITGNRQNWEQVISSIRNTFGGQLIYAANWDNYQNAVIWDLVDAIGIDAYHPLSNERDPSLEQLKAGWQSFEWQGPNDASPRQRNWVQELEDFQKTVGKKVYFTEIGYRSTDFAAREPWEYQEARPVNLDLQRRCFQAAYEVFSQKPWFGGFYIWNVNPRKDDGGMLDTNFTPLNKPGIGAFLIY